MPGKQKHNFEEKVAESLVSFSLAESVHFASFRLKLDCTEAGTYQQYPQGANLAGSRHLSSIFAKHLCIELEQMTNTSCTALLQVLREVGCLACDKHPDPDVHTMVRCRNSQRPEPKALSGRRSRSFSDVVRSWPCGDTALRWKPTHALRSIGADLHGTPRIIRCIALPLGGSTRAYMPRGGGGPKGLCTPARMCAPAFVLWGGAHTAFAPWCEGVTP